MRTEAAVRRAIARVAQAVGDAVPDARIEQRPDGVAIEGRGVRERLRWIGGLLK
ncbi:hypothetical protein P6144_12540 [Sphingomonas sp. HITSZ_GF]|uniref:hypothetical protein n=1 Tax=Sphingomonas sp. HITSZ_GF TaxID=3037247 RepID=UPI00240D5691|nr:hypothetical protein [Sphingomonas sp. HITSZ_GF]MDG2534482.1 hypothetical protein [Sphingomonas sp. HITSZ_GF]